MGSNLLDPQRSPEAKHESPCNPSAQKKVVVLFEWWLSKAEKDYNGSRLTIGGFTKSGEGVMIFRSAPIIKRHDHCTLEAADGITLRIQGPINKTRTIDNGFPLEASNAFLFGFPTTWENFIEPPSGKKPSDSKMFEHQPKNTFDPSFQQITVLLRNWWLRKAEKGFHGKRLAVGGFTECGKAMRLFDSSPIIKRHDAYTIETADGITIRIEGFINKMRTLDNGFPVEACRTFLIGFPTTWTDFANGASWEKSSEIPAIRKFTAWVSMCNSAHIPLVYSGSHHLLEKSFFDNNRLQDEESCGANMRDAHSNNQLQDDERCGTNLRDAQTGNDYEVGLTPVDNDSENHEDRYTEGVHTEGAGCFTGDLYVDRLPQEKSLNHEKLTFIQDATLNICKKCCGHEVVKDHHEGEETCSAGKFWGSVVGKDHWIEETAQKKDEKFDESSTRRPEEVRPGLSKVENLHGEYQKYAKLTAKPVRRSPRLKPLNPENVHGECQYNSHLFNETNDMNCANSVPDGSKTCKISQPTDTLAEGCSSSPNLYVEPQNFVESLAKPVRRSKRLVLADHANLPPDGSKTYAKSQPNYTILKGSPLSLTSSILLPSSGVLPEESHDGNQHSINTCVGVTSKSNSASKYACYDDSASTASLEQSLTVKNTFSSDCVSGLVEVTPSNSKALTSQTVGKRILRCSRKKKKNQTPRSRTKVEQDDSRKQSSGTSFEEKTSSSSAYFSRRKAKNIDVSTETQQAEDKASHKMGCKTVWTSSYTKIHHTPLTRYENKKLIILKPESLKRSRSGRLLIPSLGYSTKIVYEPDGSFVGTATVDLSCAPNASVAMSTSPSKGRGRKITRKKRKKQQ